MVKKKESNWILFVGFLITIIILIISTSVLANKYIRTENYYVKSDVIPYKVAHPDWYIQDCIDLGLDLPKGNYQIEGNFSWIKEYYKPDTEFSALMDYKIEKTWFTNKIVLTNFRFIGYGTCCESAFYGDNFRQNTVLIHSHPTREYSTCRFSGFGDYPSGNKLGGDINVFTSLDAGLQLLVCNTTDIIIGDKNNICGSRYRVHP